MLTKMVVFICATAGGALGWWLGNFGGLMLAFMVSMIGTGFGIYYGKRIGEHYEV